MDYGSRRPPRVSHVHKIETKLENQIQGLVTTDIAPIDSGEMLNTQKIYWNELDFYGLDYDNQQSLVNGLGGNDLGGAFAPSPGVNGGSLSEPTKLDLDAAYKAFKKYFELKHLELSPDSQEKFNDFIQKQSLAGLQSGRIEAIGSQVLDDLKQLNQIDGEHLEQQKVVDDIRFQEVDCYVHQQIEAKVQKHLDESLKLLKNHLNSLKTGQLKESLHNIGIEPTTPSATSTSNHLPSGFVYAPVYLGKDSITDFSGNGGDGIEPPGNGGNGPNGPGDDDFPDDSPNSPGIGYFALIALFWGTVMLISKVIYSFGVRRLNKNCQKILNLLEKFLGKEQINQAEEPSVQESEAHQLEVKPPILTARLPSLVPLTVAAAGLVAWSYLLSQENLLRCLNLFFNLSALLGRSFGRILLYVIPQPLQAVAILLGNGVAQVFSFTRRVLIPAIMLSRTLMVTGLKLYVLLKLATFGIELCRLFSVLTPPWLKKGVQQAVEAAESSNQIEEVGSITENPFLFGFLKSLVVFLFPFIPFPENKGIKLAGWALLIFFVNKDTTYTNILIERLMGVPEAVKLLSCILGRFACIFITVNLSKDLKEPDSKGITWLFYGSLYYYRVFGLALSASSNLLPV